MHPDPTKRRIFVQIASYRDPECHPTVTDLFGQAAHPERISVGICWQYDPEADQECFATSYPREDQVQVVQFHVRDARGAGWARTEAQKLYKGEDYILQIQAHHRFEPGWDNTLIELLEALPSEKSVLTAWLPGYKPPGHKLPQEGRMPLAVANRIGGRDDAQMLHLGKRMVPVDEMHGRHIPTCSWVGNFLFMRAGVMQEVPFDPYIYFWGEEINYSARLWTHGYDMYHLDRIVAWHYWDRPRDRGAEIYRDHLDARNRLSLARNRHLFGLEQAADPEAIKDIEKYPLGKARRLSDFWKFAGIDLQNGTVTRAAREGVWQNRNDKAVMAARIFVGIASYRDEECQHTLRALFAQAAHPERIHVGICLQVDPEEDAHCMINDPVRPEQVRILKVHRRDSLGANWARAQAQTLWNGEEYVLQIDSHMRFEPGWDEALIDMLSRCPSKKPVLCAYLPNYDPPDRLAKHPGQLLRIRVRRFGKLQDPQLLHITGEFVDRREGERAGLYPSPFYIANFMFTRASTLEEVPIDPYLHFYGDEISYSARLWTHGYDIFQPDEVVMYHYWVRESTLHQQHYRNIRTEPNQQARKRVLHLLGLEPSNDPASLHALEHYGLGQARPLESLWRFAGIDWRKRTISREAEQGRWNLAARTQALAAPAQELPRIFVAIASYRDPECQHTIKDIFDKASHPERVFVGVCWQFDREQDAHCFEVPYPRPSQVRVHEMDVSESRGPCFARHLTQKLWKGEEYTLQIDSHMRFEPGWDDILLSVWRDCRDPRAVLSVYPPGYKPPHDLDRSYITRMCAHEFGSEGILRFSSGNFYPADKPPPAPVPGAFISAGFLFGPASIIEDVPYDPHLYFYGEEVSLSARLWTHGYNIFNPNRLILYHYYKQEGHNARTHFGDHKETWHKLDRKSFARVQHLLGTKKTDDDETLRDLDAYGLGDARTLEQYQQFSGVDFVRKTIEEHALKGDFSQPPAPRIFVSIASYRDPECQHTIRDLFEKASHPERIFIGLCWQFDREQDAHCFEVPYPRPSQVRLLEIDAKDSKGVCWARAQVQKLWKGEEYFLQIDSHMRFEPGWDDILFSMWDACADPQAILSCYPPGYTPPHTLDREYIPRFFAKEFDQDGMLRLGSHNHYLAAKAPPRPVPTAFVSGGMLFGPSSLLRDAPYDPHLYFYGEEITMAARLWTHGYNFYSPNRLVIYHYYKQPGHGGASHFADHKNWQDYDRKAFARARHLLGIEKTSDAEALAEIEQYGLGGSRTLAQYQQFSGIDFARRAIDKRAAHGEFSMHALPRIFVSIASYRDPECQWTIKDLFEKARHPERVFAGVCWQFDEEEDKDCFQVSTRPEQVRMVPMHWSESDGVCHARHLVQQLWEGEEYFLQIDSHMRFVPGWDELMIAELAACGSPKPVLSCSPASYTPPDKLEQNPRPAIRRVQPFFPDGNLRGKGEALDRVPEVPLNGAFVAAGFVFARSDIIREVPIDPYLYFDQEEITWAARLYTHGWDVFSSRRPLLYHFYNDLKAPDGSVRPLHWRDFNRRTSERLSYLRRRGMARFNHLMGYRDCREPDFLRELDIYGFGNRRTLAQFEAYTGIDFKKKETSERALRCLFIRDLDKYRDTPIYVPELDGRDPPRQSRPQPAARQQKPQPPQQAGKGTARTLDACDFLPLFEVADTNQRIRAIETLGGKPGLMFFLPVQDEDYLKTFFTAMAREVADKSIPPAAAIFILGGTPPELASLKDKLAVPYVLCADPGYRIARSFGLFKPVVRSVTPTGYVFDTNLKIVRRHMGIAPEALAVAAAADYAQAAAERQRALESPMVLREVAPALMVPNVFSPEFCEKCLHAFRTGHTFDGTVGGNNPHTYKPDVKVRTDFIVRGQLLSEVDDKLSRALFPEIKKVFGFEVTHREIYKIGLYKGEKGGFFKAHRDNFDAPLGYRRLAMTLHLGDDYDGGGLRFPEYGGTIYRPPAGGAIVFSCSTLHEALPVTRGERFVMVGFFHGEEEEAYRRHYQMKAGGPLKIDEYTPNLRQHPDLRLSRHFFSQWRASNVTIQGLKTPPAGGTVTPIGEHRPKKA